MKVFDYCFELCLAGSCTVSLCCLCPSRSTLLAAIEIFLMPPRSMKPFPFQVA